MQITNCNTHSTLLRSDYTRLHLLYFAIPNYFAFFTSRTLQLTTHMIFHNSCHSCFQKYKCKTLSYEF
jgi:hypothetical protein